MNVVTAASKRFSRSRSSSRSGEPLRAPAAAKAAFAVPAQPRLMSTVRGQGVRSQELGAIRGAELSCGTDPRRIQASPKQRDRLSDCYGRPGISQDVGVPRCAGPLPNPLWSSRKACQIAQLCALKVSRVSLSERCHIGGSLSRWQVPGRLVRPRLRRPWPGSGLPGGRLTPGQGHGRTVARPERIC